MQRSLILAYSPSRVTYAHRKRTRRNWKSAGRNASASASAASNQIAEAIWPILNDIVDRFGRGQHGAVGEAASLGNEAIKFSARAGNDALGRIATQAKTRPLAAFAVAIGVGILIGIAVRRS